MPLVGSLGQGAPGDQMRVQFEPADQRVALAIFDLGSLRKTPQAGPKSITVALPDFRENADASDPGGVGHALRQRWRVRPRRRRTGERPLENAAVASRTRAARRSRGFAGAQGLRSRRIVRAVRDSLARPADALIRVKSGLVSCGDSSADPPPRRYRTALPRAKARNVASRELRSIPLANPPGFVREDRGPLLPAGPQGGSPDHSAGALRPIDLPR